MFQKTLILLLLSLVCLQGFESWAAEPDERSLRKDFIQEKDVTKKFWRQLDLGRFYLSNDLVRADSIRFSIIDASRAETDSARLQALIFDLRVEQLLGNKSAYFAKILQLQSYLSKTNSKLNQVQIFHFLVEYHSFYREFAQADIYLVEALKISKKMRNYALIA